jgi:hypothetical protein
MAQKVSLPGAFAIIGAVYLVAFITAAWPLESPAQPVSDIAQ